MTLTSYISKNSQGNIELTSCIKDERIIKSLKENNVDTLRPIQVQVISNGLFFQKNFLICTPSGSGKTLIGELAIVHNCFLGMGKGIFLVPYKALAAEKYIYFKNSYRKFGLKSALSIGDFESDEEKLKEADIVITTFEKLDSLLRSRKEENSWVDDIATVVVDEVHIMGDSSRGFKLESLIIRLLTKLYDVQMICLSATISNPENLNSWLSSISEKMCSKTFTLIKSDVRPVELQYKIAIEQNKDRFIRKKIQSCLSKGGQLLIFVNTRKSSIKCAQIFQTTTRKFLDDISKNILEKNIERLKKVSGSSPELRSLIKNGIAYHNAGLLSQERHSIERLFNQHHVKVICCTTTLAAGVNTPARVVILRDFKKRILYGEKFRQDLKNGTGAEKFYELPNADSGYFIPFSNNQTFQLLGRAGRPGLDLTGEGIILVKNHDEYEWVEDFYFSIDQKQKKYHPKYNPIESKFNKIGALREQILLLSHQENGISLKDMKKFFRKTYFSHNFEKEIHLENYLLLDKLNAESIAYLHCDKKDIEMKCKQISEIKINRLEANEVDVTIAMSQMYGLNFNINKGILCTCGFKINPDELKSKQNIRNDYQFCDHIIAFIGFLLENNNHTILRYLNDIIPEALNSERIIDFLIREGFIIKDNTKFYPTAIGSLTVQLYLKPIDMIYLRGIILGDPILSQTEILESACKFLRMQGKFIDDDYRIGSSQWINEINIEEIVQRSHRLTAGDFFSLIDSLNRVLYYFKIVSSFFGKSDISDMAETLSMRVQHGIKEDLLDLVVRIAGVGRKRGRMLYNAGIVSVMDVYTSNPNELCLKSKIPLKVCESIHESATKVKKTLN